MEPNYTSEMRATAGAVQHEPGRAPHGVIEDDRMIKIESNKNLDDPDHLILASAIQTTPTVCLMKVIGPCEGQMSVSDRS